MGTGDWYRAEDEQTTATSWGVAYSDIPSQVTAGTQIVGQESAPVTRLVQIDTTITRNGSGVIYTCKKQEI